MIDWKYSKNTYQGFPTRPIIIWPYYGFSVLKANDWLKIFQKYIPGFPDQADHNLTILWHHTNHTNFLTMILPWSTGNHIWSRVLSAWNHIWSRVWSAWNRNFSFPTRVDVTSNLNKNSEQPTLYAEGNRATFDLLYLRAIYCRSELRQALTGVKGKLKSLNLFSATPLLITNSFVIAVPTWQCDFWIFRDKLPIFQQKLP